MKTHKVQAVFVRIGFTESNRIQYSPSPYVEGSGSVTCRLT